MKSTVKKVLSIPALVAVGLALAGSLAHANPQAEKDAYQKALRQRQCEFIGKTATELGQCVEKARVDAIHGQLKKDGRPPKVPGPGHERELHKRECERVGQKGGC